jgi:hypothetical protein
MISSIRHRIEKLEAADKRLTRRIIWEDGTGSAEREIATVRAAGESSDVEFIIVSWLPREKVQWTQSMCSRRFSAAHLDRTKLYKNTAYRSTFLGKSKPSKLPMLSG